MFVQMEGDGYRLLAANETTEREVSLDLIQSRCRGLRLRLAKTLEGKDVIFNWKKALFAGRFK